MKAILIFVAFSCVVAWSIGALLGLLLHVPVVEAALSLTFFGALVGTVGGVTWNRHAPRS
jgi:hypothetical protein